MTLEDDLSLHERLQVPSERYRITGDSKVERLRKKN